MRFLKSVKQPAMYCNILELIIRLIICIHVAYQHRRRKKILIGGGAETLCYFTTDSTYIHMMLLLIVGL